jgi:hypothetical protein
MSDDHERIWLEPRTADDSYGSEGRLWCRDNVWDEGAPTEYVRADLLARVAAERDEDRKLCHAMTGMKRDKGRAEARADAAEAALAQARALIERWCWAYDARSDEALAATRDETNAWLYPEGK